MQFRWRARNEQIGVPRRQALAILGLCLTSAPRGKLLLEAVAAIAGAGTPDAQAGFLTELRYRLPGAVTVDVTQLILTTGVELLPSIEDPIVAAALLAAVVADFNSGEQKDVVHAKCYASWTTFMEQSSSGNGHTGRRARCAHLGYKFPNTFPEDPSPKPRAGSSDG